MVENESWFVCGISDHSFLVVNCLVAVIDEGVELVGTHRIDAGDEAKKH